MFGGVLGVVGEEPVWLAGDGGEEDGNGGDVADEVALCGDEGGGRIGDGEKSPIWRLALPGTHQQGLAAVEDFVDYASEVGVVVDAN